MPRAYYKPFTAYEEAVGYHGAKRNAYFFLALFFGGLLFKCVLLNNYSTVMNPDLEGRSPLEADPRYRAAMDRREELLQDIASKEAMRRAIRRQLPPPPA
ncbi:hypothetical protein STCU_03621 [Strigomonas culicis]|uniref:Transmembrane protein n=1 Tax=Strigomonas culicis TaxID=28005 RepID=S9UQJ7_9TRYP|nr:hypothetical protein STCU_03621 [Strigomonas culicis]|eukprot:EPY31103.1 hypothetical protein STCU_03621 [Strigomonas culicis]